MVTDAAGMILRVNESFARLTGYSQQEVVGKTAGLLWSGRHPPSFYAEMWSRLQATGRWEGEIWDKRKNGEIFPAWLCISVVKDNGGTPTHYVGASPTFRPSGKHKRRFPASRTTTRSQICLIGNF